MRILGQIENPNVKITLFDQNNKLSVKFEKGQAEIILKFQEDKSEVMKALNKENDLNKFDSIVRQLDGLLILRKKFEVAAPKDEELLDII